MSVRPAFRIAFPVVTLPAHMGGEDALVLMSYAKREEPNVVFANVVTWSGKSIAGVPLARMEVLRGASEERRCNLQQVKNFDGPAPLLGQDAGIIVKL